MASRDNKNWLDKAIIPDKIKVWCTDKDKEIEVLFLEQRGDTIRCAYETVPLMFKKIKPGIYVARMAGLEFVMRL